METSFQFSQEQLLKLKKSKYQEPFNLDGINTYCKVTDIYDGDTCTINMLLNKSIMSYRCRLDGYDSHEIKPKKKLFTSEEERQKHIQLAQQDKQYFQQLVENKILFVKCRKFDKYGRLLIELFDNGKSINQVMIQSGKGIEYHGGKKTL